MRQGDIVQQLMFDYGSLSEDEIRGLCAELDRKVLRWLGSHHPDNRTRITFFELTNVLVGEDSVLNAHLTISDGYLPLVRIGKRVAISPHVTIVAQSAPNNSQLRTLERVASTMIVEAAVTIEDDAWIGAGAVILPGVTVGRMSIVGAGAVVTKNVPPFSVVAGVPAVIVRRLVP